jgi:hypothetical protein
MGGMVPGAAMSVLQMGMDVAQQGAAASQAKSEARAQARQLQQADEIATRERQDQLRRALATQRARFGAQGILSDAGSAQAALGGLQAEADRQDAEARATSSLRLDRLDDQLDWQRRRSLLDASSPTYRSTFSLVQRGLRSVSLLGGE